MKVRVNCFNSLYSKASGGISIHYDDSNNRHFDTSELVIDSFRYKHHKECNHNQQYVLLLLLLQKCYDVTITLINVVFNNLINTMTLYNTMGKQCMKCILTIQNFLVSTNVLLCSLG